MKSLVWFRRDLRLNDNAALSYATQNSDEVYGVFVFDTNILKKLKDKRDHRIYFIHKTLELMNEKLSKQNAGLYIVYGDPIEEIPKLAKELEVDSVCCNRDYESYAKKRDSKVRQSLDKQNIEFHDFKDQVIFESDEVRTKDGTFYKVFTPYSRVWLKKMESVEDSISERPINLKSFNYKKIKGRTQSLSLKDIGFEETEEKRKYSADGHKRLNEFLEHVDRYGKERDLPAIDGTSKLSPYLRFGNLSVRELIRKLGKIDSEGKKTWLNELIWRDFYSGFLDVHNEIEKESYKYSNVKWQKDQKLLKAWKNGNTGVPIVDAGMRQLNETGWMHNRVRMIVGSYLTKIMLIDWLEGEKYFAEKLIDYDLASNNGGWQWCASTGTDSVPYFRIFNPASQAKKFDAEGKYITKFVPELNGLPPKYLHDPTLIDEKIEEQYEIKIGKDYPAPVADYKKGRERALKVFKEASNG